MNFIGTLDFVDSISDFGALELSGAVDVVTQRINGTTYVYVSGKQDDGIQVLSLANDGTLTTVTSISNATGLGLDDVGSLSTVQVGDEFFLIASGSRSDALTTFRIDDDGAGTDGHLVPVETYFNYPGTGEPTDGSGLLDFSYHHVTAKVGGTHYVVAVAYNSDALSVYRVESDGQLARTDFVLDSDSGDFRLDGPDGVAVHEVAGKTFVFVGSEGDDGISVFSLSNAGTLTNVFNGNIGGSSTTYNASEIQVLDYNGDTYAVFINRQTDQVITYEVKNNGQLQFVSETDRYIDGNFSDMYFTESFDVDGVPYLLMSAADQSTLLVLSFDASGEMNIVQTIKDVVELDNLQDMTVQKMGDRTFVLVTSHDNASVGVFEIGANNDAIVGTAEADRIVGMLGDDDLIGRQGNDELIGGLGDDVLSGRIGNDKLDGGDGQDVLVGGLGNDVLLGGSGSDILKGGKGKDTLSYALSDAAVTVDLQAGTVSGGHGAGDIFVQMENVTGSAFGDIITGSNGANKLTGLSGNDSVHGGGGKDKLSGGGGNDKLWGDALKDVIDGGAGNDALYGGSGNDVLRGGAGNDTLHGETGKDKLTGNLGADTFVFSNNLGSDEITDFVAGTDKIDLSAISSITNMTELTSAAFTTGGNTLIFVDGGPDSITILNVTENELSASDFIFV